MAARPDAPIGVFDSGYGGLSVVTEILQRLEHDNIVFVADQAHVPYGARPLAQVAGFASTISETLVGGGCKAVVMACNISSATALRDTVKLYPNLPVLGVILPGAESASIATISGKVGVLATQGTVESGAYVSALQQLPRVTQVVQVACPRFVPLVEAGTVSGPDVDSAVREYLMPLKDANVDAIILGCTHYPFLLKSLQKEWKLPVYINPAHSTVAQLITELGSKRLNRNGHLGSRRHLAITTGDVEEFRSGLRWYLGDKAKEFTVKPATWRKGKLIVTALPPVTR